MNDGGTCPICGADKSRFGCTEREEGAFCRAPTPPPPSSARAVEEHRALDPMRWAGVRFGRPDSTTLEPIITFPVPPSAPRVKCATCGREVIWITHGRARMPVDAETHEAHRARCT